MLIFLSGYLLQRKFKVDIKPISTLAMFILQPALVFRTFYGKTLDMKLLYIIIICLLAALLLIFISYIAARLVHYDKLTESAFMLASVFMNSGNYGAPIILFAFGEQAFQYAVTIMVFQAIIMNVFGIYIASRGRNSALTALKTVAKMPANYAIILALTATALHIHIMNNFYQAIDLIAQAAIPTVMLVLGMQLANVTVKSFDWMGISLVSLIRLVLSPILAYGLCQLFPIDPLLLKVFIVSFAMPSAATTAMYAIQFNTRPQFVSSSTFITTLLSFVTLTVLLTIL